MLLVFWAGFEQDSEWRFVLVEFVLGNSRMVDQILNAKSFDHLSLRHP